MKHPGGGGDGSFTVAEFDTGEGEVAVEGKLYVKFPILLEEPGEDHPDGPALVMQPIRYRKETEDGEVEVQDPNYIEFGSGLNIEESEDGVVFISADAPPQVGVSSNLGGEPTVPDLQVLVMGYGLAIGEDSTPEFTVIHFDSPLEIRDQDEGKIEKATGWVFGPGFTVEEGEFADQAVIKYEGSNLVLDGKEAVKEIQLGEGLEAEEVEPGVVLLKLSA